MGRVFSADDIARGRVPSTYDFRQVHRAVIQRLEEHEAVIGAILYGSVLHRNQSRRSDIDCLIVYRLAEQERMRSTIQDLIRATQPLHVPLELYPMDEQTAASPLHHIGPSFYESLELCVKRGGVIKSNPLPLLCRQRNKDEEDVRAYLQAKLCRFERGACRQLYVERADDLGLLQKALEAPVHLARKVLWLENTLGESDTSAEVDRRFLATASPEEEKYYLRLRSANAEYNELLEEAIRSFHREAYLQGLNALCFSVGDALEFTRLMARRVSRYL